jgi:hypothetical protein
MGREYITPQELKLRKCSYCGSTKLRVKLERTIEYEEVWDAAHQYKTLESEQVELINEFIHGVECADCGESLSDAAGL